jgi:hypothetical protein
MINNKQERGVRVFKTITRMMNNKREGIWGYGFLTRKHDKMMNNKEGGWDS